MDAFLVTPEYRFLSMSASFDTKVQDTSPCILLVGITPAATVDCKIKVTSTTVRLLR